METITIRFRDLVYSKQRELEDTYAFDDKIESDTLIISIQIYDKNDLNVDLEEARIQKELDNPEIH